MSVNEPVVIVFILCFVLGWNFYYVRLAERILRRWAAEHDFEVVSFKRVIFGHPFGFMINSRSQVILAITVRDRKGRERSGWLKCGSFWAGVFSNEAQVKWRDGTTDRFDALES
jgi:hypothetical protein